MSTVAIADERPMELDSPEPSAREQGGPNPDVVIDRLRLGDAPKLTGEGLEAQRNARAFLQWAAGSTSAQAEQVRAMLAEAGNNHYIVETFCAEAFQRQKTDHSGALVALAALGEMRGKASEACLLRFLDQPLPKEGTEIDGEILEQTAMATLQAKAIDGLAFMNSDRADEAVLTAMREHPSRIVRAEAIAAYLWNKKYSDEAKKRVGEYLRNDEQVFVGRPVRRAGDTAETFNPRLRAYLTTHPELRPPDPTQRKTETNQLVPKPPPF